MPEKTLHPIFAECCATHFSRYGRIEPFRIGGCIYATDANICARCPDGPYKLPPPDTAPPPAAHELEWKRDAYSADPLPLTELPCPAAHQKCEDCDGNGHMYADVDLDLECEWCGGKGTVPVIRPVVFDRVALREDFARLFVKHGAIVYPNAKTRPARRPLYWHIPDTDVDGIVMPIAIDDWRTTWLIDLRTQEANS